MRQLLLAFICLWLTACQTPPGGDSALLPPGTLPAAWEYQGRQDYESRYPGLGYSDKYESPAGVIDIYRYDLQHRDWQAGVTDPSFAAHFESTVDDIRRMAERGDYRELRVGAIEEVRLAGQTMRSVSLRFVRNGRAMVSYTYLGAMDGQLLKFRLTFFLPSPLKVHMDRYARTLVERSLTALQAVPRPLQ